MRRKKVCLSQLTKFFSGGLRLTDFLPSLAFSIQLDIFDHVFGRLRHDPAAVVKSLPSRAPGDLMKIARAQESRFSGRRICRAA